MDYTTTSSAVISSEHVEGTKVYDTAGDKLLSAIARLAPRRIVYVSFHPGTLARDIGILVHEHGYQLQAAGVLDMFQEGCQSGPQPARMARVSRTPPRDARRIVFRSAIML